MRGRRPPAVARAVTGRTASPDALARAATKKGKVPPAGAGSGPAGQRIVSRSVFVATLLSLALLAASRARAQEEAGGVEGSSAEVGRNGAPGDARDEAAGGDDTGASDGGEPDGEEAGAGAADGASGGDADRASSEGEDADPAYGASTAEASSEGEDAARDYGATAQVYASSPGEAEESLGRSSVTRALMDVRQPRSAPDALRYEPGVAVQQTAHAQASPYVRGMTGQQVVHLFDGVRMNNGIYRQGPNQYFFTIDQRTLARLDVVRGATSVRFGSDALGGAILATPLRPFLDPDADGVVARPRLELRYGSADRELGGRAALELRLGPDTALLLGGGYRDVDRLRSGGVVRHRDRTSDPTTRGDLAPWVPRFEEESAHPGELDRWRTQLGTGFREATWDARLEHRLRPTLRLVAASYGYRQMDAPRTDQCPAPEAPLDECLRIDRQFRTLSFLALRGDAGPLRDVDLVASHQRHVERRVRDRPRSNVRFRWDDVVDTLGVAFRAATRPLALGESAARVRVRYGFDAYRDQVAESSGERTFTDVDRTTALTRGQYLEGSHYLTSGVWSEVELQPRPWLTLRGGGRLAAVDVGAPPDRESGTAAVNASFYAFVGRAGVAVKPSERWSVHANVDQGFRAPNLDDMTSRQQVGPGFQFENPELEPERTVTTELGLRGGNEWLRLDLWAFATLLEDGIQRVVREIADCPPSTPDCRGSRDPFQLVNADERSRIFGGEGGLTLYLPRELTLRATFTYAWGDGPSLGDRDATPPGTRVPLSRIPPPQGTLEGRWRHRPTGLYLGGALRWAAAQGRLAVADASDPRIPRGGTPGYAVLDLRAGWRWKDWLAVGVVVENLFDAAYRVHGSSIQQPGRGGIMWVRLGY